jgi:hypothetical protein
MSISPEIQSKSFTWDDFKEAIPDGKERKIMYDRMYKVRAHIWIRLHSAIPIKCGELEAMVDTKIANIISYLWGMGIKTTNSCESNNENVWIVFETFQGRDAAINLLNLELFMDEEEISLTTHQWQEKTTYILEFPCFYRDAIVNCIQNPFILAKTNESL